MNSEVIIIVKLKLDVFPSIQLDVVVRAGDELPCTHFVHTQKASRSIPKGIIVDPALNPIRPFNRNLCMTFHANICVPMTTHRGEDVMRDLVGVDVGSTIKLKHALIRRAAWKVAVYTPAFRPSKQLKC